MKGFLTSVRAMFQFCTILPLGQPADYDEYARRFYLMPLTGYLVGGLAALASVLFADLQLSAAVALAVVMVIYGFNHFDGLLDLGDGLMAHGSREKRIKALTDQQIGAGGVATGILVLLLTYSGLLSVASIPFAILAAEVMAKFSQVVFVVNGKPFREGMHSYTHSFTKWWFTPVAFMLCLPLLLLPLNAFEFGGIFIGMAIPVILLYVLSNRLFGGVNGDVAGASNEIVRMFVIIALAILS
ncbi:adenosylcobinamide-GDP ribazoletransferase [Methanoplanus sp. FWC-SCC4]|uniref:Adenosylcobinamide-GDP ribazoletransferase n=1 Tax=Methanochimaera problematica TaxID=2609417 RepID=A0AA97FEE5_9EURY|nr:adenosylcobinamide-GDP ribazoletransferase [Methanoplanus sp. FWC-SCC4]WOF17322.1 adenosylcobinamide-GDP ribazoletransferase [Methanoplanus sp. FWC-SCC4]